MVKTPRCLPLTASHKENSYERYKRALEGKGLSNEVNIHIFAYDASEEMTVRHFVQMLKTDQTLNCRLIEQNLYQIFLKICDDLDITEASPPIFFIWFIWTRKSS